MSPTGDAFQFFSFCGAAHTALSKKHEYFRVFMTLL